MGVAKGVLGPWSPYLNLILCRQPSCQHCKTVLPRLSKRKHSVLLLICHFGSFRNSVWPLRVTVVWQLEVQVTAVGCVERMDLLLIEISCRRSNCFPHSKTRSTIFSLGRITVCFLMFSIIGFAM